MFHRKQTVTRPRMVSFNDPLELHSPNPRRLGGIIFDNYLICGCCGAVYNMDLFCKETLELMELEELEWISISSEIMGE